MEEEIARRRCEHTLGLDVGAERGRSFVGLHWHQVTTLPELMEV
jgi:hypothetical protein